MDFELYLGIEGPAEPSGKFKSTDAAGLYTSQVLSVIEQIAGLDTDLFVGLCDLSTYPEESGCWDVEDRPRRWSVQLDLGNHRQLDVVMHTLELRIRKETHWMFTPDRIVNGVPALAVSGPCRFTERWRRQDKLLVDGSLVPYPSFNPVNRSAIQTGTSPLAWEAWQHRSYARIHRALYDRYSK